MPAYSSPNNGNFPSVAALPIRFGQLTLADGVAQATGVVFSDGLPGLRAWFFQVSGAGFVTVNLQFSNGVSPGKVPDFQALVPAYGIVISVASLNEFSLGTRQYRASLLATGGVAVVRFRLAAALT